MIAPEIIQRTFLLHSAGRSVGDVSCKAFPPVRGSTTEADLHRVLATWSGPWGAVLVPAFSRSRLVALRLVGNL